MPTVSMAFEIFFFIIIGSLSLSVVNYHRAITQAASR